MELSMLVSITDSLCTLTQSTLNYTCEETSVFLRMHFLNQH